MGHRFWVPLQHGEQAGLLVTLILVLHVAAEEGVLPPEVSPIP